MSPTHCITTRLLVAALICGATTIPLTGCTSRGEAEEHTTAGSLNLGLEFRGEAIDQVTLVIESQDLEPPVSRTRMLTVPASNKVTASEDGLLAGTYTISLSGSLADDPTVPCAGSVSDVEVRAGQVTHVSDLILLCTMDGGDLQQAGGIDLEADVEVQQDPDCGDLVQELSISPLDLGVGESATIVAVADDGVSVSWKTTGGTVNEAGDTYTCPAEAGVYTLTADFVRHESCSRTVTQNITCRASEPTCAALDSKFAFTGDCGLRSPCHVVEQAGCQVTSECRGRALSAEGIGNDLVAFSDQPGRDCQAEIVDGKLSGFCADSFGMTCTFETAGDLPPAATCAELPQTLTQVTTCGTTMENCDVIQDGCTFQAQCDDGSIRAGSVAGNKVTWDTTLDDTRYRCAGELVNGRVDGECLERGFGPDLPSCGAFSLDAPADGTESSCTETLPDTGFALAGCGLDGLCFASQSGCAWQIACDHRVYSGLTDQANAFRFESEGRDCLATVVGGEVVGSCLGTDGSSCSFAPVPTQPDPACFQMPGAVTTGGCGAFFDCDVLQDGCEFQASCQGGQFPFHGTSLPAGITFPGLNGFTCALDLNDDVTRLLGECTRENPDGSVTQCRDLTDELGARFVVDWN